MKTLDYGESPFDRWTREQLVRFAQRSYYALSNARGALSLLQVGDAGSVFWADQGTGGTAMAMADAVVREVGYDAEAGSEESENLYRMFYRPFGHLLFADAVTASGEPLFPVRWVCDSCDVWREPYHPPPRDSPPGGSWRFHHDIFDCPGIPRIMTVDDLPPIQAQKQV